MNQQSVIDLLLVLSSMIGLIAAGMVYWVDKKSWPHRFLSLVLIFAAAWAASILAAILSGSLFVGNFSFWAVSLILVFVNLFIMSFSGRLTTLKTGIILGIGLIVSSLVLIDGLVVRAFDNSAGYLKVISFGPLFYPFFIFIVVYLGIYIYQSIVAYRALTGVRKLQVLYIIIGSLLSAGLGLIFSMILPALGVSQFNNLGPIFMIFTAAAMSLAATKHYLYDRQVVFSELWAFILILISIVWLVLNLTAFNIVLFVLLISISLLFIRTTLSEANKKMQLQRDKEELQKLDELKDDFLRMAEHELNTPIGVIEGKLSMILDENFGGFSEKQKEYLSPVFKDAKRLAKVNKALVEVSEIDQNKVNLRREKTSLLTLINEVVAKFQKEIDAKGLKLSIESVENLPEINIDPEKIKRVLTNLIGNAVKFTTKGEIKISAALINNEVVVSVADTGMGIKPEEKEHIFEKFYQAERFGEIPMEQQGIGLSLYISKYLIKLHGGRLWLESAEGQGTKFSFSLPR